MRAIGEPMSHDLEMRKIVPSLVWYRPFLPYAHAFVRLCAGAIFVYHGVARLFFGVSIAELGFASHLPPSFVGVFELFGGAFLALGLLTRPVALLFAIEWLLIAIAVPVRPGTSWLMLGATPHYPAMVAALCLAFAMSGGGQYSLDRLWVPGFAGAYERLAPLSGAFLRVVTGLMFVSGGIDKVFHGGASRIAAGNITMLGLPFPLAWGWTVAFLEFFGGIMLVLGLFTRPVAFALTVELTVVAFGIMALRGFSWTAGGMEVALLMESLTIAFVLAGGGRFSLDRRIGREF